MPHFISPDGRLHFIDELRFEYLLPPGSLQVPDRPSADHDWDGTAWVLNQQRVNDRLADEKQAEVNATLAASGHFTVARLIESIEVSKTVAQLGGVSEAALYAANPMYRQSRDLRDALQVKLAEIAALRG